MCSIRKALAVLLCAAIPTALLAVDNGYKVAYDGGSLPDLKAGTDIRLYVTSDSIRVMKGNTEIAKMPPSAVTEISYGQDVHRRVGAAVGVGLVTLGAGALLALAKSKKHFIGLTWDDGGKKGGFA